jgi:hypothetical protein
VSHSEFEIMDHEEEGMSKDEYKYGLTLTNTEDVTDVICEVVDAMMVITQMFIFP